MKLIFENYRKHLREQEINELRRAVLNEISENDYDMIKDWMANAPEEAYSFRNLFGGKKRIAIPVETGAADGPIGEIVRLFQDSGWKIDFKDSLVSKEIIKTIPKGPRAGEKISQTKKMRIGKALSFAEDLMKKYSKFALDPQAMADDILPSGGTSEAQKKARAIEQKIEEEFPGARHSEIALKKRIPKLIEFWNEKSEFYRQQPEAAFEKESPYVTILSRHPVDVVRMSDMNNITSCHSRGGGYFQCAVAESRGHGPIAFLVPRREFERYFGVDLSETDPTEVDLDEGDEEIFEDQERGVRGIRPEGRVRLRKFVSNEDGRMITAPERRTYAPAGGRTPPNFLKGVTKWALDSQKNVIGDPKKVANDFYNEDWTRYGGSYEDTLDGPVMAAMLEPYLTGEEMNDLEQAGNMPQELEDEDEIEREMEGGSIEARAEAVQDRADEILKHFGVYHEIMDDDWGGGPQRVYYNGSTQIELSSEFGEPLEGEWDDYQDEVNEIMTDAFDNHYLYIRDADPQIYEDQWSTEIPLGHDDEPTVEGFESFVNLLHSEGDASWDKILEDARDKLVDAGIIEPELSKALRQFKRYDRIGVSYDSDELEKPEGQPKHLTAYLKKRDKMLSDYRSFKEYPVDVQEAIKAEYQKIFRQQLWPTFRELYKDMGIPPSNVIFDARDQGFSVELDGIYNDFKLQLNYFWDSQVDAIKRFLNMLNTSGYYNKIGDVALRAYYDAVASVAEQVKNKEQPGSNYVPPPEGAVGWEPPKESKKSKISDKMLFESWRRYLNK